MSNILPMTKEFADVIVKELKRTHFPIRGCHLQSVIRDKFADLEHAQYWAKEEGYVFAPTLQKELETRDNIVKFKIGNNSYYQYRA